MKKLVTIALIFGLSVNVINSQANKNVAEIDASKAKQKISKYIYSHFSEHLGHCIYEGIWVGENSTIPNKNGIRTDVVEALKKIQIPSLRWPGGCFADEYHWKDGIGPRNLRPSMINTNWGGVTEDNSFGTHEFMELCNQLGCEPYISGNVGSGTIQEMSQWVEYLNSDNVSPMTQLRKQNGRDKSWGVKFWGVGNETWGCGGNMKPDYYSDLALHFSSFLKNYGSNNLRKIMVGPSDEDYNWTETVMKEIGTNMWGLSLHSYTWANTKSATDFDEAGWFDVLNKTLRMETLVTKHSEIMDKYDPAKSVALAVDEWGTWYAVEPGTNPGFLYQQNTLRDALVAGINLNIFNNHCDRVRLAAIAQVVNVLQAVILTDKEKMILTPTYHVFDMYKVHQDALLVPTSLQCEDYTFNQKSVPSLNMSTSIDKNGVMHITICNLHATKEQVLTCNLKGYDVSKITGEIISADKLNAHNTFDKPNEIGIKAFTKFKTTKTGVDVTLPAHSVVMLTVDGKRQVSDMTIKPKNPKAGLKYDLYEGTWTKLPNFTTLTAVKQGVATEMDVIKGFPELNFGVVYKGLIKIEKDGMYDFGLSSDDGSRLIINDECIISNDGLHGMVEMQGSSYLQKGYHKFEVQFFQGGGGAGLQLFIQGPDMNKQLIPASMLWYE
ncbi:MAG TPA: alpha-L-arabinofuranosidase C-terminal domain-containing protein [Bacteroidales bacterium]|nr:alpha-L-arabinofuranosidase C-terminal domain-containing protein [Bacteroidales bacterium]